MSKEVITHNVASAHYTTSFEGKQQKRIFMYVKQEIVTLKTV